MKKIISILTIILITAGILTACTSKKVESTNKTVENNKKEIVKLGITGEDHRVWDSVKERLAKENIDLQIVSFADYVRPNLALAEGEVDLNAFQNYAYLNKFKADRNLQIASIGDTLIAPMGIYSETVKNLKDLKEGAKIAIPNDATNLGRALILLQSAGLIKLKDGVGLQPTVKDITENTKKYEIIELVATQIPRSLKDVDVAVINSGVAVDAKFSPKKDAIFLEDVSKESSKPYINLIAAREKDKDNPIYKKVVKAYQTEETKKLLQELYLGAQIPAF